MKKIIYVLAIIPFIFSCSLGSGGPYIPELNEQEIISKFNSSIISTQDTGNGWAFVNYKIVNNYNFPSQLKFIQVDFSISAKDIIGNTYSNTLQKQFRYDQTEISDYTMVLTFFDVDTVSSDIKINGLHYIFY